MPATSPTVAVVICAYTLERWHLLLGAVESVRAQVRPPAELIVVADHNDALLQRARAAFPDATVIANRETAGLSGARNSGVAAATSDVIAFLDDDAAAEPAWLEQLVAPYADPRVAGVGGAIVPSWSGSAPPFLPEEFWWVIGCSYRGMPAGRAEVRNMLGANMSLRRVAIGEAGGFDPTLGRVGKRPVGCEETELCIRIRSIDPTAVILNEPAAVVHHHVPPERATWGYFRSRCFSEGISKARVRRLHGRARGLSTERSYVATTLTRAVVRELRWSAANRSIAGASRAVAALVGVGWAAAGFAVATVRLAVGSPSTHPARPPLPTLEIRT